MRTFYISKIEKTDDFSQEIYAKYFLYDPLDWNRGEISMVVDRKRKNILNTQFYPNGQCWRRRSPGLGSNSERAILDDIISSIGKDWRKYSINHLEPSKDRYDYFKRFNAKAGEKHFFRWAKSPPEDILSYYSKLDDYIRSVETDANRIELIWHTMETLKGVKLGHPLYPLYIFINMENNFANLRGFEWQMHGGAL